ncbi:AmmeMemoRadiSam system radical SAM enzyme [[Eubacterium] cellulosolvens]
MKEAMFWEPKPNKAVKCKLCAHNCKINEGKAGICQVRENKGGKLYTRVYGLVSPGVVDPIEKKPLYNFHPGSRVYSFGTVSCNFKCDNCQNWHISQVNAKEIKVEPVTPETAVGLAKQYNCKGIAWTYNEPTIWFEYTYDGSKFAKKNGLYSVYVTNGFINPEPLKKISPYLDALNIDVKSFNEDFYRKICKGKLTPVMKTAELAVKLKKHVEITNLVIPTLNDDPDELRGLVTWVHDKLGPDVPMHFSRFHPDNRLKNIPITPEKTLVKAYEIAKDVGLNYVYLGNIYHPRYGNTYCPKCNHLVIRRGSIFGTKDIDLINGKCGKCNYRVIKNF